MSPEKQSFDGQRKSDGRSSEHDKDDVESRVWRQTLDDIENVGPNKPVGYLPINTIQTIEPNIDKVAERLQEKGLVVKIFTGPEWPGFTGSLYVYDRAALQNLLNENRLTLIDAGWPLDADSFVNNLYIYEPTGTPLFKLIARAFADDFSEHLEPDQE